MPLQQREMSEIEKSENSFSMRKPRVLDMVEVIEDIPKYGIRRGEQGVIVEIFDYPEEAYVLEFVDENGASSRLAYWVKPDKIKLISLVKVFSKTVLIKTNERIELINLTSEIRGFVEASGIEVKEGLMQVSLLHSTAALFINEWQDALLSDVKEMIERIVPRDSYYKHNDPEFSDCDRHNADSHLRNIIFGHSLSIPISRGNIVLGQWQSVIMAEFDGPNQRKVFIQVFGI